MNRPAKIRVFIVDNHPLICDGVSQLLSMESDMEVVGTAPDRDQALAQISASKPDVALVDLTLKDSSGMELIKELHEKTPQVKILVLSMHDEQLYAPRALRSGARGYVMKEEDPGRIIEGIRHVHKGRVFLSERMRDRLMDQALVGKTVADSLPSDLLTDRELEVFELIGQGVATRQIADKLFVSVNTVETYRERIKDKLGLKDSTELVKHAIHFVQSQTT